MIVPVSLSQIAFKASKEYVAGYDYVGHGSMSAAAAQRWILHVKKAAKSLVFVVGRVGSDSRSELVGTRHRPTLQKGEKAQIKWCIVGHNRRLIAVGGQFTPHIFQQRFAEHAGVSDSMNFRRKSRNWNSRVDEGLKTCDRALALYNDARHFDDPCVLWVEAGRFHVDKGVSGIQ